MLYGSTCNALLLTGQLPVSFASLSGVTPTTLVLSNNNLFGGIPEAWGNRNSPYYGFQVWAGVGIANNSQMCGQVPFWYFSNFATTGLASATALVQGKHGCKRMRAWLCLMLICLCLFCCPRISGETEKTLNCLTHPKDC